MAKKKEPRMSIFAHLGIINRPGSSVPKEKRTILTGADKDIRYLQGASTARTKAVKEATGAESDPEKAVRERARKARRDLAKLRM